MLVNNKISQTAFDENKANGKLFKIIAFYIFSTYKKSANQQKKLCIAAVEAETIVG